MLLPRFTLRTILAAITVSALFFVLIGAGYRGQLWAWGAAIGVVSLEVTLIVQAALFCLVRSCARLSKAQTDSAVAAADAGGEGGSR
jgi:hypothetical protein